MDFRLELVFVPVSDVDAAKASHAGKVGCHLDHDHDVGPRPPVRADHPAGIGPLDRDRHRAGGAAPGSRGGPQVVVDDTQSAREDLRSRGVRGGRGRAVSVGAFVRSRDPDRNAWAVQQRPRH